MCELLKMCSSCHKLSGILLVICFWSCGHSWSAKADFTATALITSSIKSTTVRLLAATAIVEAATTQTKTTTETTTTITATKPTKTTKTTKTTTRAASAACEHETDLWGDVNPNVYHICDNNTHTPLQLHCPVGSGFFNGLGYYGCIPFEQWPACITLGDNNNNNSNVEALCGSGQLTQPWGTVNPNAFYMCGPTAIDKPVLVDCQSGRGFVQLMATQGASSGVSVTGCAKWANWRKYMQCEHYF